MSEESLDFLAGFSLNHWWKQRLKRERATRIKWLFTDPASVEATTDKLTTTVPLQTLKLRPTGCQLGTTNGSKRQRSLRSLRCFHSGAFTPIQE